jgi:hypothetical protein
MRPQTTHGSRNIYNINTPNFVENGASGEASIQDYGYEPTVKQNFREKFKMKRQTMMSGFSSNRSNKYI